MGLSGNRKQDFFFFRPNKSEQVIEGPACDIEESACYRLKSHSLIKVNMLLKYQNAIRVHRLLKDQSVTRVNRLIRVNSLLKGQSVISVNMLLNCKQVIEEEADY